jgi:hypothetical protein
MRSTPFAVALLAGCFASSANAALSFSDDFSGPAINSFWWAPSTIGANTVTLENGRIVMTQSNYYDSGGLVLNFNVSGDFVATVDYSLIDWPAGNYERIGISTGFGAVERSQNPGWFDEAYVSDFQHNITTVGTTDTTGTLKMERTGSTLTGSFWNGTGWTFIGSYTHGTLLADAPLGLVLWNGYSVASLPIKVSFDNFYLSAPDMAPIPEPAAYAMFLAGLGLMGFVARRRRAD